MNDFPVDDTTLLAVEHALDYTLTVDEDGQLVGDGSADYSLHQLLDFMAGCVGEDPNGYEDLGVVHDTRIHYTEKDVIRALIAEVRRLRDG